MKINCHTGGRARRGIALVITLIMLSVTLVMAIAFLALARRERNSVSTTTDTTTAKLAADSALAAAQAQIMANILSTAHFRSSSNALYSYGLLVSTNYYNSDGFAKGIANPTNVNFFAYDQSLTPAPYLNQADFMQNVANLQFLPRVPVFIQTNNLGSNEFRFYLDLNRNGAFDDTGDSVPSVMEDGTTNGTAYAVGDPQWVGVLARPDAVHSADNQFVSRYAFMAVPIGNGLDINAIHNQTLNTSLSPTSDGFFRNEGVGSWELNLAAFLADLNTNAWDPPTAENPANNPYYYGRSGANANRGVAFEDALSILTSRYDGFYNSLAVPLNFTALVQNNVDFYTMGPLMTTTFLRPNNFPSEKSWVGSDNTNHFYNLPSDLYNPAESSGNFVTHLTAASSGYGAANPSTYDRYTYYRLLSQMGTDSDPDDGKMNLNFRNIVNGTVVPGMETNAIRWTALGFFTNAADRMLRMYTTNWFYAGPTNYLATYYFITNPLSATIQNYHYINGLNNEIFYDPTGFGLTNVSNSSFLGWTNTVPGFGITNIPVYVNGRFVYSPAVNRVLQLAANMYDASTNSFYPSVFRPMFKHDNLGNVFIMGYTNLSDGFNTVAGLNDVQFSKPFDAASLTNYQTTNLRMLTNGTDVNVYGVPWIIGAKKGFPSFNKFGMQTVVQATRKLQLKRSSVPTVLNSTTFQTNQLLAFNINNTINADCWNSYSNRYSNLVQIYAADTMSMSISNDYGAPANYFLNYQISSNTSVPLWLGYTNGTTSPVSFTNPLSGAFILLTNSDFYFGTAPPSVSGFVPDSLGYGWESNNPNLHFPQFTLFVTNQLQLYMLDYSNGLYHVIDYVQLGGTQVPVNLTQEIEGSNPSAVGYGANMWSQSVNNKGVPYGILSQMTASEQQFTVDNGNTYWASPAAAEAQINGFANFMGLAEPYPNASPNNATSQYFATNYVVQVPYTPTVTISEYTSWQANDPLVHYLASDLNFNGIEKASGIQTGIQLNYGTIGYNLPHPVFNVVNEHYQPWGIQYTNGLAVGGPNGVVESPYSLVLKDPLIWGSDYWNFSTNLYPNVGWIGRVHRGTPWQTVYLKADDVLHVLQSSAYPSQGSNTWANWTGDGNLPDLANSAPVQDRQLFDLFTARPNDNAALGTLSVNQTNLAAWSAVFSGMVALTNTAIFPNFIVPGDIFLPSYTPTNIAPAAVSPQVQTLLTNINFVRTGTNLEYGFTNADGVIGSFEHAGDILAAPALTEHSPFLNWTNLNQQVYGISDAAYEWLPQQMMGLVRGSSTPRYVIYAYGQALRPAPGGVVTGSANFGLVTNYQVVAESAIRAIVSVHAQVDTSGSYPVTNYTTRVESYSVLPPD